MNNNYLFRIGPLMFILNVQHSSIGYGYPRIFISFPDCSYVNLDLTLGALFPMSEADWSSWFDNELVSLYNIKDVNKKMEEAGINWPELEKVIFEFYREYKGE